MNTQADEQSTFQCFGQCGTMLSWWRDGQRLCPDCSAWQYETWAKLKHEAKHSWEEYVERVRSGFCWILDYRYCKDPRLSPLGIRGQGGVWGLGWDFDHTPVVWSK